MTLGCVVSNIPNWLRDYDQISRLCSLRTQGWGTEVRFQSPAAVRFRTSRPAAAPNSATTVLMGS